MAETFSVEPEVLEEQPIPVVDDNAWAPVPSDPATVEQRAVKANMAFPQVSVQEARADIFAGRESQLRTRAAAFQDVQRQIEVDNFVRKTAQYKGSPLTPAEHKFILDKALISKIQGLQTPTDPETVLEEYYAGEYLKSSVYDPMHRMPEGFMQAAVQTIPREVQALDRQTSGLLAKQEYLSTWTENTKEIAKNQPWFGIPSLSSLVSANPAVTGIISSMSKGFIGDLFKQAVPGYNEVKLRGNVPNVGTFKGGALGENLLAQSIELFKLPMPEFKEVVKSRLEALAKDNPALAVQYAEALMGMSTNERVFNNLLTAIEVTGLSGIGRVSKGIADKVRLFNLVRSSRVDVLRAARELEVSPAGIAEASGDIVEAAVQRTMRTIEQEVQGKGAPVKGMMDSLPSLFSNMAWNLGQNRGAASRELLNRVEQNMHLFQEKLEKIMGTVQRVARLPTALETEEALNAVVKHVKDFYPGKYIADVSPIRHEAFTNTHHVEVTVHRPGGQLWADEQVARNYARDTTSLGRPDAEVVRHGQGFKLIFKHPLRETDEFFRDLLVPSKASEKQTWAKALLNRIRNPDDVMDKQNTLNRKVAVYAQSEVFKLMKEEGKAIRDLGRGIVRNDPITGEPISAWYARPAAFGNRFLQGELFSKSQMWKQWESTVKFSNEAMDPVSRTPGYLFQQAGELEGHYLRHFGRLPEPIEVEAYFAYRNRREAGRIMENIGVLRDKLRLGAERHNIFTLREDGTKVETEFEGILRPTRIHSSAPTLVVGTQLGMAHIYGPGNPMPSLVGKEIDKQIARGSLKFLEVLEPGKRSLSDFEGVAGGVRVRYVIAPYVETRALSWEQVPLKGAFREFPYDFTVGQAIIKREQIGTAKNPTHWYEGDRHAAGFVRGAEGKNYAKHMNEIQRLVREGDLDAAKAYSNKHMNRDWDEIYDKFKNGTYALDEPFQLIPRRGRIGDLGKTALENRYLIRNENNTGWTTTIEDGTRTGLLAGRSSPLGDDIADVLHVKDVGSRLNPVFDHAPANTIDLIPSMDRGLNKMVNSVWMDDYKLASVEQWIRDAAPHMTASEAAIRSAPFYHFHQPVFQNDVSKAIVTDLLTQKRNIEQLVGTPNAMQTFLHSTAQKLYDYGYGTIGPKTLITPEWLLPKLTDPFQFIRSITFHESLGLYNYAQIALNLNTFVNIYAFAGARYAVPGTMGAFMQGLARVNSHPNILNKLDEIASKIKIPGTSHYKRGDLVEAINELNKTGFKQVQGENIMRDAPGIRTMGSNFLEYGTVFWKGTEKVIRIGAWHTAMREFRDKVPTGQITDRMRAGILDRADFLSANMSRASASVMHTGALSVPMQFGAYIIRIAEGFWSEARMGPFLSKEGMKSRARVLATYSAAYGVPAGLSVTGFPVFDGWRKSALENGYNPGENYLRSVFEEGVPATTLALITGNWYNINERYALQGMEIWKDIWRGDKGFLNIAFGAAGSKMAKKWEAADPFFKYMFSFWKGDGEAFQLTPEHGLDVMRVISSWDNASRAIAAINTGKWMNSKGVFLEGEGETGKPISVLNASFMSALGLSPTSASDIFALTLSAKDIAKTQQKAIQAYTQEIRRAYGSQESPDNFNRFMSNAYFYLVEAGIPEHKWADIHYQAMQGINRTLRETIDFNRYIRDSRPADVEKNTDAYSRSLRLREQR